MVLIPTTYLEMLRPPEGSPLAAPVPVPGVTVIAERLSFKDYMPLWQSVGEPLDWDGRLLMPREAVETLLANPHTDIQVLRVGSTTAGFCEFNRPDPPDSEIKYFGLKPEFQGKRLGRHLLDAALRAHWAVANPRRIWLHTDTWDDARALPLYERAGFRVFARHDLPETALEAHRAAIGLA